jgi:hypothetical protein
MEQVFGLHIAGEPRIAWSTGAGLRFVSISNGFWARWAAGHTARGPFHGQHGFSIYSPPPASRGHSLAPRWGAILGQTARGKAPKGRQEKQTATPGAEGEGEMKGWNGPETLRVQICIIIVLVFVIWIVLQRQYYWMLAAWSSWAEGET